MAFELDKPDNHGLAAKDRNDSMNSESTATTSSGDSSPATNAYAGRKIAHAEELANRLIAFSQLAQTDVDRRDREATKANPSGEGGGWLTGNRF